MNAVFNNRHDAGQKLAQQLTAYTNNSNAIVLALPRGGVPVAYEVAKKLNLPLDVCLVRKISLPNHPETAMGAIAEDAILPNYTGYITIIDCNMTKSYGVEQSEVLAIAAREKAEIRWRETCYRHYRPMLGISDRTVIIVDDGMATGLTMHAAVEAVSRHQPLEIIVAVPVASWQAIAKLAVGIAKVELLVDDLVCLERPKALGAVGFWYEDFSQTTDREVCDLLSRQTCQHFVRP
ncbi:MAG: phosphoribosyltransferase family protein [Cyanobacteria bacterium J06621_12]